MELNTSLDSNMPVGCGCQACQHNSNSTASNIGESENLDVPTSNGPDNLLSGAVWANDGTGVTITYNFWTSLPSYYSGSSDEATGFKAFTAQQKAATLKVLDLIETYTNITFVETTNEGATQLGFAQSNLDPDAGAWAYYPSGSPFGGDVWTNRLYVSETDLSEGGYDFYTLLHEVGHALGLQHTFEGGLTGAENTEQYSVMAYDWSPWGGGTFAETFQIYDIWALQELYGVNTNHNTGNDTYILSSGDAYSIWDAGGTDTLDGSAINTAMTINLDAGTFSSVGQTDNIAIAYNVIIENAEGGSNNDLIYGNEADNVLNGNAGDDTIWGYDGSDTIDGGAGYDIAQFVEAIGAYSISLSGSNVTATHIAEGFVDTMANVEEFIFNGVSYLLGDLEGMFGENTAPTTQADNFSLQQNEVILANTRLIANDAQNNIVTYSVWDGNSGGSSAYFELNGVQLSAGSAHHLSAAEFATLNIVGGANTGTDKMWFRVSDSEYTTNWDVFNITTTAGSGGTNTAPTVTANDQSLQQAESVLVSTLFTINDAEGDALTYHVWDGGLTSSSGYFELNGVQLSAGHGHELTQAEWDNLLLVGGSALKTEKMWIKVSDGEFTTNWDQFKLTTTDAGGGGQNTAPTVTANDQSLAQGQSVLASTLFAINDAEGDSLTYEVWDGGTKSWSGYFELNGVRIDAGGSQSFTEAEWNNLLLVGGSNTSTEKMWIRVSDAEYTTSWDAFNLTTTAGGGGANSAPTVTADNQSLQLNQTALASSLFAINDAEGDTLTYEVWDGGTKSFSGYFDLNGVRLAHGVSHSLTEAEWNNLSLVGGSAAHSEKMWVRVSDGEYTTKWDAFFLTTTDPSTIGAPDLYAFDSDVAFDVIENITDFDTLQGDRLDVSDLISGFDPVTDAVSDFVQITDNGSDSAVSVDQDGGGDSFVQIATLSDITGLTDEGALYDSGNLII